ncbi:MAG: lysophospholipid acyltransferase family protein [Candidatus Methylomirabilia bacterium]
MSGRKAKKRKKSKFRQIAEYAGVYLGMVVVRLMPRRVGPALCRLAGDAVFLLSRRRRNLALENLQQAFGPSKSPAEIRSIARRSVHSFLMTGLETMWISLDWTAGKFPVRPDELEVLRQGIREVYDKAGGVIFVTLHLGNWELLLHAARLAEIPVAVVARPLDNPLLERLVTRSRTATGHQIIYKKNALAAMREALRQGMCVAILADQSSRGLPVSFFGRPASTTVVPAILAYRYNRPIVVTACIRTERPLSYRGEMSEPFWPDLTADHGLEIRRLTEAMNGLMERFIRGQPDQWLWMHDRWKHVRRPVRIP